MKTKTTATPAWTKDAALEVIAIEILGMGTLDSRGRDSLDFYDLSCTTIKRALEAAYETGLAHARNATP
jgi:hypothetical protein